LPISNLWIGGDVSEEGVTGTREEIVADQIANAMKVTGTTKTAMAARMRMD
jgi:hypothetical protein